MRYLIAAPIVLGMLALAVGALSGKVRARSCCSIADPRLDPRMRGAEPDQPASGD